MYHYLLEKYVRFTLAVPPCRRADDMWYVKKKSNVKYDDNDKQRQTKY